MRFLHRASRFFGPWLAFGALSGVVSCLTGAPAAALYGLFDHSASGSAISTSLRDVLSFAPWCLVGGFLFGLVASAVGRQVGVVWAFLVTMGMGLTAGATRDIPLAFSLFLQPIIFNILGAVHANRYLSEAPDHFRWQQPLGRWLEHSWLVNPRWGTRTLSVFAVVPLWCSMTILDLEFQLYDTNYPQRLGLVGLWQEQNSFKGPPREEWGAASKRRYSCQSNLTQIALGLKQYLQDYDGEMYPPKPSNPVEGVAVLLMPYVQSKALFQCPNEPLYATDKAYASGDFTDYWFNANVYGRSDASIEYISSVVGWGDGNSGGGEANAAYSLSSIPADFGPARRHLDGANYAFLDGHVKWLKAGEVSNSALPEQPIVPTLIP